jgi:hypothetical protein
MQANVTERKGRMLAPLSIKVVLIVQPCIRELVCIQK